MNLNMSLDELTWLEPSERGLILKTGRQNEIYGLDAVDTLKRIKTDIMHSPSIEEPDNLYNGRFKISIYGNETNSRLEKIGFSEEVDKNRIVLAYSDRLSSNGSLKGDYFKKALKLHDFADQVSFIATMEAISRMGLISFEKMLDKNREMTLFTEANYQDLIRFSRRMTNPLIKDSVDSRIYLTGKFVWGYDVEPNRLHLTYH